MPAYKRLLPLILAALLLSGCGGKKEEAAARTEAAPPAAAASAAVEPAAVDPEPEAPESKAELTEDDTRVTVGVDNTAAMFAQAVSGRWLYDPDDGIETVTCEMQITPIGGEDLSVQLEFTREDNSRLRIHCDGQAYEWENWDKTSTMPILRLEPEEKTGLPGVDYIFEEVTLVNGYRVASLAIVPELDSPFDVLDEWQWQRLDGIFFTQYSGDLSTQPLRTADDFTARCWSDGADGTVWLDDVTPDPGLNGYINDLRECVQYAPAPGFACPEEWYEGVYYQISTDGEGRITAAVTAPPPEAETPPEVPGETPAGVEAPDTSEAPEDPEVPDAPDGGGPDDFFDQYLFDVLYYNVYDVTDLVDRDGCYVTDSGETIRIRGEDYRIAEVRSQDGLVVAGGYYAVSLYLDPPTVYHSPVYPYRWKICGFG